MDQIPICEFAKTILNLDDHIVRGEMICLVVNNRIVWVLIIFFCLKNFLKC